MRPAKERPLEGPVATAASFLLVLAAAVPAGGASGFSPPEGSVHAGQFTTGGCVHVCESLAMCKDAHVNDKNGACWLVLDRQNADYTSLIESCPRPENRAFSAEMSGGNWRLTCASGPATSDGKAKPGAGSAQGSSGVESLPDIKPF